VARRKEDVTLSPEEQEEFDHEEDDEELAAKVREESNRQGRMQ